VNAKGANDVVTVADVEAEAILTKRLTLLAPGLVFLGEEGSAADPDQRRRAETSGNYWLVDPLDGTREFVAGGTGFGVLVALVQNGAASAGWIYLPVADQMYDGSRETGVRRNGTNLEPNTETDTPADLDALVGFALTRLCPPAVRERVDTNMRRFTEPAVSGSGSAASAYADLLERRIDFGFYWRTEPWDHVAGAFLLELAGGRCSRLDGEPYEPGSHNSGLLVTGRRSLWAPVRDAIYPTAGPLFE
jgi:fructose-1,6-bisphosphatase/inositol monophosphatase family enzyme